MTTAKATARQLFIPGLSAGRHTVHVSAVNSAGESVSSRTKSFTVTSTNQPVDSDNPFFSRDLYNPPDNAKFTDGQINGYGSSPPPNYDLGFNTTSYPGRSVAQKALRTSNAVVQATWLSGESGNARQVGTVMRDAQSQGQLPLFLLYNIPNRDNSGGANVGGAPDLAAYQGWINSINESKQRATGSNKSTAVFIIEPDALNLMFGFSPSQVTERTRSIRYAAKELTANGGICYIDIGTSYFSGTSGDGASALLRSAGIVYARGFSTNISNFAGTESEVILGNNIISQLFKQYKIRTHQVIDTSRNGSGPYSGKSLDQPQYNPPGRSCGPLPTCRVGGVAGADAARQDAFLWLKTIAYPDVSGIRSPQVPGSFPDYVVDMLSRSDWFAGVDPARIPPTSATA